MIACCHLELCNWLRLPCIVEASYSATMSCGECLSGPPKQSNVSPVYSSNEQPLMLADMAIDGSFQSQDQNSKRFKNNSALSGALQHQHSSLRPKSFIQPNKTHQWNPALQWNHESKSSNTRPPSYCHQAEDQLRQRMGEQGAKKHRLDYHQEQEARKTEFYDSVWINLEGEESQELVIADIW